MSLYVSQACKMPRDCPMVTISVLCAMSTNHSISLQVFLSISTMIIRQSRLLKYMMPFRNTHGGSRRRTISCANLFCIAVHRPVSRWNLLQDETIHHLFFECPMARLVWRTVFVTFNLPPPSCIANMFGRWLNGMGKSLNRSYLSVLVRLVGPFGIVVMIWCLTKRKLPISCRLFFGQHTGSVSGPYCFRWWPESL